MFSNTFLKSLYDWRYAQLGWGLAMIVLALLMSAIYPSIQDSAESFNEAIRGLPSNIQSLAGYTQGGQGYATFEGFLSLEVFGLFLPVLTLAFAITFGAGLIAEEEQNGNFALLLSTQTPRWRIVVEKILALVVFTLVTLAAIYLGFIIGIEVVGIDADAGDLAAGVFNVAPMTLVFAALAYCITGLGLGRGMALGVSAGLAAITYILEAMGSIGDVPDLVQELTPWYYYGGGEVLREGLDWGNIAVLLVAAAILFAIGTWAFQRRDINT